MGNRTFHPSTSNRRNLLRASGLGGIAFLAGCLGDDEEPIDDTDDEADDTTTTDEDDELTSDDSDDADDGMTADDADDSDDDTVELPEIHDATLVYTHADFEPPADHQYNSYGGGGPYFFAFRDAQARLIDLSWSDFQYHGEMVRDWDYQPGLMEFTIYDDFYWWRGDQVTAEDYIHHLELMNYHTGGDDLDAWDNIVAFEQIDDFRVRLSLADTWNQNWAISQSVFNERIANASRAFTGPWLEQFIDAGDLDAVNDIRDEFAEYDVTTDEELVHNFYAPYEFRLDGSIGAIGETYWEFELVREKNGNLRHFANPENSDRVPNYRTLRAESVEDPAVWETEKFLNQEKPYTGWDEDLLDDVDFPTKDVQFFRPPFNPFGFQFNHDVHPGDNVHFRRAWAYLTDNTAWERFDRIPARSAHPFLSDEEMANFVSADVIDAFTDYGWNEHRWDDAETELVTGGIERNADGDWLLTDDSIDADAGEPMDFEITTFEFTSYIVDEATDFWADLEDFGIQTDLMLSTGDAWGANDDYVVTAQYTGGGSPENAFSAIFVEAPASRNAYNVPSVISMPELYQTADVGASTDEWIEFEVNAAAERLGVTTQQEAYQALVDQLAWAVNQTIPHFSVAVGATKHLMNDDQWSFMDHEAYPEKAIRSPFRLVFTGAFMYDG